MILVPIRPSFWSLRGRPRKLQTLLLFLLSVSHSITIMDEWAFMLTHINIKGNKKPPNNCRGAFSFMTTSRVFDIFISLPFLSPDCCLAFSPIIYTQSTLDCMNKF